ncbi:MAG TPA: zeta toxin family protein, partial [Ignavibacteria bacterium]|nr:zeta toxin family protein [Ignavibacteria bacterium]
MNKQPNLYIIAGANGAVKTTSAFTVFPEIMKCKEYINADLIAKALSPFNPESNSNSIQAGRIMINRINKLIDEKVRFAFETTLSSRSFDKLIEKAKKNNYKINIIFLWINDYNVAFRRVKSRVKEGGHSIPAEIIKRRYYRGLFNLINIYLKISDFTLVVDNSGKFPETIAEFEIENAEIKKTIHKKDKWNKLLNH